MNVLRRLQRQASSRQSTRAPTPAPHQADALTPAQALGNQFMQAIQPKLSVNEPGDAYEQEADRMATRVTSAPDVQRASEAAGMRDEKKDDAVQAKPLASQITPLVQRASKSAPKSGDEQKKKEPPKPAAKSDSKQKDDDRQAQKKENNAPKKDDENKVAQKKDQAAPAKDDDKQKPTPKPEASKKKDDDRAGTAQTQRRNAPQLDDEDEAAVQRRPDADSALAVSPSVERDIARMQAGGRPLDPAARSYFEPRFGADFSRVRVHDDAEAARAAEALNAQAFTQGEHVFFNSGRYQPNDTPGRQLLAHELTHTVQQGAAAPSPAAPQAKAKLARSPKVIQRQEEGTDEGGGGPEPPEAPAPATTAGGGEYDPLHDAIRAVGSTLSPTVGQYRPGEGRGEIVFDKIKVPQFKRDIPTRGTLYTAAAGSGNLRHHRRYSREMVDQRTEWRNGIGSGNVERSLDSKVRASVGNSDRAYQEVTQRNPRFIIEVPVTGGRTNRLIYFGTQTELLNRMLIPLWGKPQGSGNPPFRRMQVDHVLELQIGNHPANTAANTMSNFALLNAEHNAASGGFIWRDYMFRLTRFVSAVMAAQTAQAAPAGGSGGTGAALPTPAPLSPEEERRRQRRFRPSPAPTLTEQRAAEELLREYHIVFQGVEWAGNGQGGLPAEFNETHYWTQTQIANAEHMGPVRVSSFNALGSASQIYVFTRRTGGEFVPFEWSGVGTRFSDRERTFLRPFRMVRKAFNVEASTRDSPRDPLLGQFELQLGSPPLENQTDPFYPRLDLTLPVQRIFDAQYAGYISREYLLGQVNRVAQGFGIRGASPIVIDDMDILTTGIFIRGRIMPSVPLLAGTSIDFVVENGELRASKTFTAANLSVPRPLTISTAALTLAAGTRGGISADGRVDFGIERVGQGFLEARAQTGTGGRGSRAAGFALTGGFDFDSRLFDPASIRMRYENGQFSGEGNIGIPEGRLRGIRSAQLRMAYAEGRLTADGTVRPSIPGVQEGTMSLVYSEQDGLVISGTLTLAPNPAIRSGSLQARVERQPDGSYKVAARGTAEPAVPNVNSQLTVAYDDGAFDAEVTADFTRGMLRGQLRVAATNRPIDPATGQPNGEPTDRITVYGGGQVTIRFSPWLQGTAGIRLLPNGEIEVSGEIGLPSAVDVFPAKRFDRNLFRINVDIPIIGVSVAGQNIGVFATIGGGLDLTAGIGPGQIRDLRLGVTYNPAHEDQTHVTGHGEFVIPADAGLRLLIRGGLGVGIPIVDATAGIEIGGQLGLEGQARAAVDVDWTPQRGVILDAVGEIFVEPKFKFDVSAYVEVTADLVLTEIELYSQRWRLAQFEYGSNLRFGVSFPIHYEDNQPFNLSLDDLQFTTPEIEPMSVVRGLLGLD